MAAKKSHLLAGFVAGLTAAIITHHRTRRENRQEVEQFYRLQTERAQRTLEVVNHLAVVRGQRAEAASLHPDIKGRCRTCDQVYPCQTMQVLAG